MIRKRVLPALMVLAAHALTRAAVTVSIPDQDVPRGATVNVPIKVQGLASNGSDSLIAYQAVVAFNTAIVQAVGASKAGTMTQNWGDPTAGIKGDTLRVAGFTTNQAGKRWVADDGNLVNLNFFILGDVGNVTTVRIHEIKLFSKNGAITVGSKTDGQLTVTANPATKTVNIDLYSSWNLISFSLTPTVNRLPDVFGGVPVTNVFCYVSGIGPKTWDSARPAFLNDLKNVDGIHGYWMKLYSQTVCQLSLTGVPTLVTTPMLLYKEWSLVSYLPDSRDSLAHSFSSLGKAYRYISSYQASGGGTQSYDRSRPVFLNDLKIVNPGLGYWIRMDTTKTLIYPLSGYKVLKSIAQQKQEISRRRIQSSSKWCDFWAFQPDLFVPGDTVKVYDSDGVLCGDTLISVERAFLVHVAGDDPVTPETDEGALEGDTLRFEIGGKTMRVAGASLNSPDTAIVPSRPATWEYMSSKRVLLAFETNSISVTHDPVSPEVFNLKQNHPNPFNNSTVIRFEVREAGPIALTLFDIRGRILRSWRMDGNNAGIGQVTWDGKDARGDDSSSGIYFYRLEAGGRFLTKKCLFIK